MLENNSLYFQTVEICRKYVDLHAQYADKIIEAFRKTTQDGSPVNAPVWWIDSTDKTAQTIDSGKYKF